MKNKDITKDSAYKNNYLESLRTEMVEMVEKRLSPVALKYSYSETPLEENIKWRPVVLLLGNYSSGKSTLINELLGFELQKTGQAPTDDSFTVITYDKNGEEGGGVKERDGKTLLSSSEYPFAALKKHGQRFASHFKLKQLKTPFLENLAIIDTPGMLDSMTEKDRGYNYQNVIGDLASIADLILVLFDPHKAGTIKETYDSLRRTLPQATYEDRIIFVLNRIDECTNLSDLLRVYGSLCWNLSQMTGRKDIPMIHLTYALEVSPSPTTLDFLKLLENQRSEIREAILRAPEHRLDHLATYIEEHGDMLAHYLEAFINYGRKRNKFLFKSWTIGFILGIIWTLGIIWGLFQSPLGSGFVQETIAFWAAGSLALWLGIWWVIVHFILQTGFHQATLATIDQLTPLTWQSRMDSWNTIKPKVTSFLEESKGRFSLRAIKSEFNRIQKLTKKISKDVRKALNEISELP